MGNVSQFNWDEFRNALNQAMNIDGINANRVAKECGVSAATLSRLLSNGIPVSLESVIALSKWMGKGVDDFTQSDFKYSIGDVIELIEAPLGGDLYEYGDKELLMEFKNGDKFRIRISRTL